MQKGGGVIVGFLETFFEGSVPTFIQKGGLGDMVNGNFIQKENVHYISHAI